MGGGENYYLFVKMKFTGVQLGRMSWEKKKKRGTIM